MSVVANFYFGARIHAPKVSMLLRILNCFLASSLGASGQITLSTPRTTVPPSLSLSALTAVTGPPVTLPKPKAENSPPPQLAPMTPDVTSSFNSTFFIEDLLHQLREELQANATINTILTPFEIEASDDDVADTNLSATVFRGYFTGFDSPVRKDRCSHKVVDNNVTLQCLITFLNLKSIAYATVKGEERALVIVTTSVEDVIFLMELEGPLDRMMRLYQFKSVLDPTVKSQIVEGSVRAKWLNEFKSQVGQNIGIQLMRILYRDFRQVINIVLSRMSPQKPEKAG
ncbi:uncharacterized protein LOC100907256 [Galendromus occidentalis]|uniref:Uncharacterized protein LOC100907256 n=1 Tax=Galendromus occidentalis TaxID=34638 RepID=A0AAJ6QMA7_9ACAR|nr:uncharacterized protein LOC100907256 [Galendromus occidentalis]